jgi:3'-5' exonuclease
MLEQIDLSHVLVFDIETVSQYQNYDSLDQQWQHLWNKKANVLFNKNDQTPDTMYGRAAIYAEFGKIVCISVGNFQRSGNSWQLRIKSFYGDDEKVLLEDFCNMMRKSFDEPYGPRNYEGKFLCGHNIMEFDVPYISRRLLIHQMDLPVMFDVSGKKPWEIFHLIDTLEKWKFGDYKSFTSLELLASAFNIATPKEDIDGSMVGEVYWQQKDLNRIKEYCQKDVVTVAQLLLRFRKQPLMDESDIIVVS